MNSIAEIIDVHPGLTSSAAIAYTITLRLNNDVVLKDVIPLTKKDRDRAHQLVDVLQSWGKTLHDQLLGCRGKMVRFTQDNGNIIYLNP